MRTLIHTLAVTLCAAQFACAQSPTKQECIDQCRSRCGKDHTPGSPEHSNCLSLCGAQCGAGLTCHCNGVLSDCECEVNFPFTPKTHASDSQAVLQPVPAAPLAMRPTPVYLLHGACFRPVFHCVHVRCRPVSAKCPTRLYRRVRYRAVFKARRTFCPRLRVRHCCR